MADYVHQRDGLKPKDECLLKQDSEITRLFTCIQTLKEFDCSGLQRINFEKEKKEKKEKDERAVRAECDAKAAKEKA